MKVKDGKVIEIEKSDFEDWSEHGSDTEFDNELIIVHDPSVSSKTISDYILGLQTKVKELEGEIQSLKYDRVDLINRCKNEFQLKATLDEIKKYFKECDPYHLQEVERIAKHEGNE